MTFPLDVLPLWLARAADDAARGREASRPRPDPADSVSGATDEDDIVALVQRGDVAAFELLFFTHAEGLATFAAGYLGSRGAAEDVVADIFATLWERRAEWTPAHGVRAYLYAAARNRALNAVRDAASQDRLVTVPAVTADTPRAIDEQLIVEEQVAIVRQVIDAFPEPRRRIMELRWRDGLSAAEIAVVLGTTRNAVDIQLTRALHTLRTLLPGLLR